MDERREGGREGGEGKGIPEVPGAFFLAKSTARDDTHSFLLQELQAVELIWRHATTLEKREREKVREML